MMWLTFFGIVAVLSGCIGAGKIPMDGVTCRTSSEYSVDYKCENAYNGKLMGGPGSEWASKGEGDGAFIEVTFPSPMSISGMQLFQRCAELDQYGSIDIMFSYAGKETSFTLGTSCGGTAYNQCSGIGPNALDLKQVVRVIADTVKFTGRDKCVSGWNGGIREIEFFGSKLDNIAMSPETTCDASSEYSADYKCENAFNGKLVGGEGSEWASKGEGKGAWIELKLSSPVDIGIVKLFQRCAELDQYHSFDIEFYLGTEQVSSVQLGTSCGGSLYNKCSGIGANTLDLGKNVVADSVKFIGGDKCVSGWNGGIREIELYGVKLANVARSAGVTCKASSVYSADYACEDAYNGVLVGGPGSEWASKGEKDGAWLELTLPSEAHIVSLRLFQRCAVLDQYKSFEISFGNDIKSVFKLDTSCGGSAYNKCGGIKSNTLTVKSLVTTNTVRVTGVEGCQTGWNGGIRELEIYAVQ